MNWENLWQYLLDNLPMILMQISTIITVILGKNKTPEQIQAKKKKELARTEKKNKKQYKKLQDGYMKENNLRKEVEE